MANPPPADRLALALCRVLTDGEALCAQPCSDCLEQSAAVVRQVASELWQAGCEHSADVVLLWLPEEDRRR